MRSRLPYGLMVAGGLVGIVAAGLQNIEKMQLLQDTSKALTCDLSAVFNCSTVLSSWQSSVFGFPNSLMCLAFFTVFATVGIVGLSGGQISHSLRHFIQGLGLFVLAFAIWFLWQSIYSIQAMCLLCLFCFAALLVINWAWLRINAHDMPIGKKGRETLAIAIKNGLDTAVWVLAGMILALLIVLKFYS